MVVPLARASGYRCFRQLRSFEHASAISKLARRAIEEMRSRILPTSAHSTTIDMARDGLRMAMSHGIDPRTADAINVITEANWMVADSLRESAFLLVERAGNKSNTVYVQGLETKGSLFLIFVSLA